MSKTKIFLIFIFTLATLFLIYDIILLTGIRSNRDDKTNIGGGETHFTHGNHKDDSSASIPQPSSFGTDQAPSIPIENAPGQQEEPSIGNQAPVESTDDSLPAQPSQSLSPSQYHSVYKQYDFTEVHPSDIVVSIVTENRPHYLKTCLESLSQTLFFNKDKVIVFQYGDHKEVNKIVEEYGVKQVKNPKRKGLREGAQHIAYHYKFIMSQTFSMHPNIQSFLIVEDDMIFAPDFLIYFAEMAPILHKDPTVYAVSAYNDNGFRGLVKRDNMAYRTDFFVGLGWLVSRRIWEKEWSKTWPQTHWDHFLRDPKNRKGRHTIFPEISRIYHIGYKGTHSTVALYEQYFRDIVLNSHGYAPLGMDAEAWSQGVYERDVYPRTKLRTLDYLSPVENYDKYIGSLFESSQTIFLTPQNAIHSLNNEKDKILIFFYQASSEMQNGQWYRISLYFDLWHTIPVRGAYEGALLFEWNGNTVLAVASYSKFSKKYSKNHSFLTSSTFSAPSDWEKPVSPTILDILISKKGQSCRDLCQEHNSECDIHKLIALNSCKQARKYFGCKVCESNKGADQPAMDVKSGKCLVTEQIGPQCQASHPQTKRLCACFNPEKVSIYHGEWRKMIQEAQYQATHPYLGK